jgi:hypothetical protein
MDPRGRRFRKEAADTAAMRLFVEECSHKALEVSFRCESLTNLQRGRLLDILLWAGELFLLLRTQNGGSAQAHPSNDALPGPRRAIRAF